MILVSVLVSVWDLLSVSGAVSVSVSFSVAACFLPFFGFGLRIPGLGKVQVQLIPRLLVVLAVLLPPAFGCCCCSDSIAALLDNAAVVGDTIIETFSGCGLLSDGLIFHNQGALQSE